MDSLKKILLYLHSVVKKMFQFVFFISSFLLFASYYSSHIHPASFMLLPLLSLLFPLFLLINFFWILFFAVSFRVKKLLFAVFIQAFFFPQIKNYYNISFSDVSKNKEKTLSVLSFNVKLFDLYNWQDNFLTRAKIFEYLKNHPADIICFQEFYTSEDSNDFNNLDELKKIFPDYYFHHEYFVTLRKNDHWGLLTMSKYPIIKRSVINFNNAKNNGCIYTDILFNDDTIRIYNLHLQSYSLYKKKKWKPNQKPDNESFFEALDSTARGKNLIEKIYHNSILKAQQIEAILNSMKKSFLSTLIVGDFNDIPNSYTIRKLKNNNFTDAFSEKGNGFGITYHDKLYLRIDYVFHDESFRTLDFITENNEKTKKISDHYPIRCILELKK